MKRQFMAGLLVWVPVMVTVFVVRLVLDALVYLSALVPGEGIPPKSYGAWISQGYVSFLCWF